MSEHFTLTAVKARAPSLLRLEFADGQRFELDVAPLIRRYRALFPLADPAVFATAALGEGGGSVVWSRDGDLELAADNLRARAVEAAGGYSHEFIWNWMARHHLTLDAAAEAIGVSRRMLAYYRSGKKPLPRTVALACRDWEAGGRRAA
ncbi:MAG: DUF2442 domain-containing protein [Candidatus Accumulibacter sp.]|jgi:hypothetical protein|nr:DUF2442 domain-containing protein [Accumulibacter sp.]